jgi:hypothetical protein
MLAKTMNEINHELPVMPPPWCGSICRNSMSDVCVGHCAVKRDCSFFDPKKNLKLGDMPRFPETKDMTKEERFTSVTIYLAKVVDHLTGKDDESLSVYRPYRLEHSTERKVATNVLIAMNDLVSSTKVVEELDIPELNRNTIKDD